MQSPPQCREATQPKLVRWSFNAVEFSKVMRDQADVRPVLIQPAKGGKKRGIRG